VTVYGVSELIFGFKHVFLLVNAVNAAKRETSRTRINRVYNEKWIALIYWGIFLGARAVYLRFGKRRGYQRS
jgi:hypothetical protein